MLIQCHSCNTKYRLNLEQIPRRKTFVRCKNCGTPIYIDPTEEEAPAAGVIPPPPGTVPPAEPHLERDEAAQPAGQLLVVCPSCDARYRIAEASVQRPGVKLKCSQCGHLFTPPMQAGRVPEPGLGPRPAAAGRPREMPLPDERQMDEMFDDLRPGPMGAPSGAQATAGPAYPRDTELGTLGDEAFDNEPPAPDSERAYLDAVAIDEDEGALPEVGTVPDDQKYRFFLNPKSYQGRETGMADQPEDTLDPMPPQEPGGSGGDLPPLDVGAAPPPKLGRPPAASRDEMARIREVVPGQDVVRTVSEKRVLTLVGAAAVAILVATAAWGYWLAASASDTRPFRIISGQPHQLALANDLTGHYVNNVPSGKRLFVVNGELSNNFPDQDKVRWIRIKATAYTDPDQTTALGTAYAYAGNQLDDAQLTHWELQAIKAYYGFTNGRKELNVSIPAGAKVPFQLVFADVEGQVGRTVAEVVSYHLAGRAVFVDTPR